jgi:hypothetical protein
VLAFILASRVHSLDHVLKTQSPITDGLESLHFAIEQGLDGIRRALIGKNAKFGGIVRSERRRKSTVRGELALYGIGQVDAARELAALFGSKTAFEVALNELVTEHFGMT